MRKLKFILPILLASIFLSAFSLVTDMQIAEAGKQNKSNVVTLVWPGDFHLTAATGATTLDLQRVLSETNTVIKPDFIHLAGDNTDNGTEVEYQLLKEVLSAAKMPVYPMIGDHDVKNGTQNWERFFGEPYYSFDHGGYHYITLNSMDGNTNGKRMKEGFSKEQLRWLESDLENAESRHLTSLLFWHHYPPDKMGSSWEQIRKVLTKHHVLGVLNGHAHFNQITNYGKLVLITTRTILSPADSKNTGYAVVCLDNGTLSWKFKELNQNFPLAMITYPANNILAIDASSVVSGNSAVRLKAFSDQKITQSRYRIDEGEWMLMSSLADEGMWQANFDSRNLSDGEHKLTVEVTDSKGRKATDENVMIVNQQRKFVASAKRSVPAIIPKGYGDGRNQTILMGNDNELFLSIGAVGMMTKNGLQRENISILSITPNGIFAGSKEGLFQSNGGAFFTEVKRSKGEEVEGFGEITAIVTDKRGIIYVSTHHKGIFQSNDKGATWEEISRQLAANQDDFHVHSLVVDSQDRLYIATASGIFRSDNEGDGWLEVGLEDFYIKTMSIDQSRSTIYVATKEHEGLGFGAVYRSTDGTAWSKMGNDILKKEDVNTIFVSLGKVYALTKNGLYLSSGNNFSFEKDLSNSMGFYEGNKGQTGKTIQ